MSSMFIVARHDARRCSPRALQPRTTRCTLTTVAKGAVEVPATPYSPPRAQVLTVEPSAPEQGTMV